MVRCLYLEVYLGVTLPLMKRFYDPSTGVWIGTGGMGAERLYHRATLLSDGNVLVSGGANDGSGDPNIAEIYDSSSGTWYATGTMNAGHVWHTATLLNNGMVLVSGGAGSSPGADVIAELFDPSAGTWSLTGDMLYARKFHQATLLNNGKVLVTGDGEPYPQIEWYDSLTGVWSFTGVMNQYTTHHTATLLDDGNVLVVGDMGVGCYHKAELGVYYPTNTVSATLTLPAGWTPSRSFPVSFVANASGEPIMAGALSNDGANWGDWISATNGIPTSTIWEVNEDGIWNIHLRLKDTPRALPRS